MLPGENAAGISYASHSVLAKNSVIWANIQLFEPQKFIFEQKR